MKTDEGYELIRQLIDSRAQQDPKIRSVQELIADGSADFKDTSEYSRRSSEILGTSLSEHILELDDEAREEVCKKLLHDGYEDINDVLAEVQTSLDEKTGVNIRPKKPPFQTERVATFAHSLADHTVADHVIKRRAKNGAANISMSDHDRYMKENAKLRHNAGLKCYIERDTDGSCCEWCSKMAGSYVYGEEPKDVYRRHDNCGCSVTYKNGKQRQNVWSKKTWEADKDERISKTAGKEPTVFGKAEAHAKQSEILAQRQLTYDRKSGIITEKKITSADEEYNSVLLKKYNKGTDTAKAVYDKYIPYDKTVEDYHYPKNPHHSPKNHMICLDVDKDKNNPRGAGTTWFHEHGHYIDYEKNYFSCNDDYLEAIRNDVKNFEASVKTAHNYRSKSDMRMAIGSELVGLGDISHSIQDIYGGAIGKPYPGTRYVHKKEYWNRHGRYGVCKEAFAHMYEASFTPEKAKLMEQYLPTAWAEFNKMLGGIV